jgi:hypothetical protein
MMSLSVLGLAPEYTLFGAAGLITLAAYVGLILVPAIGSFGRVWEKAAAFVLSLFILVTLVVIGVAVGLLVVRYYNELSGLFG